MKPWARYEVGFINHDKFRAISANAIALWLEGKNYADGKLTDGLLPDYEVKHWRFYSRKSAGMLTVSCGIKPGTDQAYAPLWELVEGFGFKMHDYLAHNDTRDIALDRIAKAEDAKQKEAQRKAAWRAAKESKRASGSCPADVPPDVPPDKRDIVPLVPDMSGSIQKADNRDQKTEPKETRTEKESLYPSVRTSAAALTELADEVLQDRGARLVERYGELFLEHRRGARYRPRPNLDWQEAMELCRTWPDQRLEKLAILVLTTDDPYISNSDRSFKMFAMKASWADDRLTQWELRNGVVAV